MTTYRDLSIHQRITAKANALFFSYHYRVMASRFHGSPAFNLLGRVSRHDPGLYCPSYPFYAIQTKTNHYDPTPYETRY